MADKYDGIQTGKNLETAFAAESQARNKYTHFASKAEKEGYYLSDHYPITLVARISQKKAE